MELSDLRKNIDAVKEQIDKIRPLPADLEKKIMDKFRLDWNYHSSSIEGNSLTFGETKTFLLHGLTASGKPLKDHIEVRGHNDAVLELMGIVKGEIPLREIAIRNLHELVLKEPYTIDAVTPEGQPTSKTVTPGQYKLLPNHVRTATGEIFRFAEPGLETSIQMRELVDWYNKEEETSTLHPLDLAALLHYKFIRIHPFDDGNGRIARLLMNLVLMKHGYPPVVIKVQDKENYYRALRLADGDDLEAFVSYIGEQLLYSVELYLRGAKGESIDDMDDVDKRIELFKAQLDKDSRNVQTKYSPANVTDIIQYSLIPLLKVTHLKLSRFNSLFYEAYQVLIVNRKEKAYKVDTDMLVQYINKASNSIIREISDPSLFLTLAVPEIDLIDIIEIQSLDFRYVWNGFLHAPTPFNHGVTVGIHFEEFQYSIYPFGISKPYHQYLTEDECRQIANQLAEQTLDFIKEKTGTDTSP